MKLYSPCATYYNKEKRSEENLFTYDSATSIKEAMKAFDCWLYGYHYSLTKMWIEVTDDDTKEIIEVGLAPIRRVEK